MNKNRGITLIALMVTIVVLLILLGATVTMLIGQNGILARTQNAKFTTEISQLKEEWNIEKISIQMQGEQTENINASGEDVKKYVKSIPYSYIGKFSIVNGELAYDINKFSKEEQLILKTNYRFKATGDNIVPYGSIEKKVKDGKVFITVFSADDESDVDDIILPDGTSKKIQYDTENILLRGQLFRYEGVTKEVLNKYFKNVTVDENNKINDVIDVEKYNVILDLNAYGSPTNYNFLNECFENGKNLITSGNDSNTMLAIIEKSFKVSGIYYPKINQKNELTKFYDTDPGKDSLSFIKFKYGVNVWYTATINGQEMDTLGEYENEKGTKWIHNHLQNYKNTELFYRNAIYRVTGSRSATYEATENGTYIFTIKDLAGNTTEISTEVTEL